MTVNKAAKSAAARWGKNSLNQAGITIENCRKPVGIPAENPVRQKHKKSFKAFI